MAQLEVGPFGTKQQVTMSTWLFPDSYTVYRKHFPIYAAIVFLLAYVDPVSRFMNA
jgi:hypothetical protein